MEIFGKEYDINNLPQEIILDCNCKYELESENSYINTFLCQKHNFNSLEFQKIIKKDILTESLKQQLIDSDYKAIKFSEGFYTAEEYESIKQERQAFRDEINNIEQLINDCESIEQLINLEV